MEDLDHVRLGVVDAGDVGVDLQVHVVHVGLEAQDTVQVGHGLGERGDALVEGLAVEVVDLTFLGDVPREVRPRLAADVLGPARRCRFLRLLGLRLGRRHQGRLRDLVAPVREQPPCALVVDEVCHVGHDAVDRLLEFLGSDDVVERLDVQEASTHGELDDAVDSAEGLEERGELLVVVLTVELAGGVAFGDQAGGDRVEAEPPRCTRGGHGSILSTERLACIAGVFSV